MLKNISDEPICINKKNDKIVASWDDFMGRKIRETKEINIISPSLDRDCGSELKVISTFCQVMRSVIHHVTEYHNQSYEKRTKPVQLIDPKRDLVCVSTLCW